MSSSGRKISSRRADKKESARSDNEDGQRIGKSDKKRGYQLSNKIDYTRSVDGSVHKNNEINVSKNMRKETGMKVHRDAPKNGYGGTIKNSRRISKNRSLSTSGEEEMIDHNTEAISNFASGSITTANSHLDEGNESKSILSGVLQSGGSFSSAVMDAMNSMNLYEYSSNTYCKPGDEGSVYSCETASFAPSLSHSEITDTFGHSDAYDDFSRASSTGSGTTYKAKGESGKGALDKCNLHSDEDDDNESVVSFLSYRERPTNLKRGGRRGFRKK